MSATKTSILLPLSVLLAADPCRPDERIASFTARHGRPPDETSTLLEWVEVTERLSDLLWGLRFIPRAKAKRIRTYAATRAARRVLHFFEAKYPDDARPRRAIELAEKWLENPRSVRKEELRRASSAAASAAADAAAYAVDAAADAAAAARAASYAADAASTTYYAAQRQDFLDALEKYL